MGEPRAAPAAETLARVLALLSYATLAVLFAGPLVEADAFGGFAFQTGVFILLWEFISLHARIMVAHVHEKSLTGGRSTVLALLAVYGIFALALTVFSRAPLLILFMALPLIPKFMGAFTGRWRASVREKRDWILGMGIYVAALILPIVLPLPLPSIPTQNADPNTSGIWIERPEVLALTGALYFSALFAIEIVTLRSRSPASLPHTDARVDAQLPP